MKALVWLNYVSAAAVLSLITALALKLSGVNTSTVQLLSLTVASHYITVFSACRALLQIYRYFSVFDSISRSIWSGIIPPRAFALELRIFYNSPSLWCSSGSRHQAVRSLPSGIMKSISTAIFFSIKMKFVLSPPPPPRAFRFSRSPRRAGDKILTAQWAQKESWNSIPRARGLLRWEIAIYELFLLLLCFAFIAITIVFCFTLLLSRPDTRWPHKSRCPTRSSGHERHLKELRHPIGWWVSCNTSRSLS